MRYFGMASVFAKDNTGEMEALPFTEAEWSSASEATRAVVNAMLAGDAVLRASQFAELVAVLDALRKRYGDHPVLLETEADFAEEVQDRVDLYELAIANAIAEGLPTLSICLSYARLLIEDIEQADLARRELLACRHELDNVDVEDRDAWVALLANCERLS